MPDLRRDRVECIRFRLPPLLALAILFSGIPFAYGVSGSRETPIVRAVREAGPSVVNIQGEKSITETPEGTPTAPRQVNGMGTGVVIDPRGYILTNFHVVDGVKRINVTLENGRTYIARIVARDKQTDLALIRIRASEELPVLRLGTSQDLMPGETVVAVGNAFGYEHTVTTGIISALHRNVQVNDTQQYLDLIQTDASINPGNSGGPLLNVDGEMIGLNVAVRAGAQGIGFAIPIDKALEIATRLISIEHLDNNWHGMTALLLDGPKGPVTVARVDRNSPARQGGLQRGDTLDRIGSTRIKRPLDVERALLGRRSGDNVKVVVERDGQPMHLDLVLAARNRSRTRTVSQTTPDSLQQAAWETLGMKLERVSRETLRQSNVPYEGGMRVLSVRSGSSAADQGVSPGDILVRMHRWTITSEQDIRFIVARADALARSGKVKFYIVRGDDTFFGHMAVARRGKAAIR